MRHQSEALSIQIDLRLSGCRLEFPRFNRTDPLGWLYRTEQFFLNQQTPTSQRLLMTSYHVEGKTLQWFRWMDINNVVLSWDEFANALIVRFGLSPFKDHVASLKIISKLFS